MSRPRSHTTRALALVILTTSALAGPASAAPTPVALWTDGHAATRMRPAIAAALPRSHALVPARLVARALPSVERGRGTRSARLAALGARLAVPTVLYVRVDPRSHQLLVAVARDGGAPIERHIAARALKPTLAELLGAAAPATAATATAAPPSPPPATAAKTPSAAPPPPSAAPPPPSAASPPPSAAPPPPPAIAAKPGKATRHGHPATPPPAAPIAAASVEPAATVVARPAAASSDTLFFLALDGGVAARRLSYNQPVTQNLPTYSVAAVPWLGFRAALFPFARTAVPFIRDLGAVGDFGHSLYQQSIIAGSTERVQATWSSFDVGLRERIGFHDARRVAPTLGIGLAYGREAYTFDAGGIQLGDTPSVDYRYLRPALDGGVAVGPLRFGVDFGYRAILSPGYVGSRFPHARVGGIDLGATVAVALPRDLELRLAAHYQRYFYDLRPEPGDPYVAGGALDEFVVGELALAYGF